MKRFLIGTALCALFAVPGWAGEPAKVATQPVTLSLTQMDKVTAGASAAAASGDLYAQAQAASHVGPGGQSLIDFALGIEAFQGESCTNCTQATAADR
jgi:hypothetical protein